MSNDTQYVAYEYTGASGFAGRRFMGSFPDKVALRVEQGRLARTETPATRILLVSEEPRLVRDSVAMLPSV